MGECSFETLSGELILNMILALFKAHERQGRARREETHARKPRHERECGGLWILRGVLACQNRIQMRVVRYPEIRPRRSG